MTKLFDNLTDFSVKLIIIGSSYFPMNKQSRAGIYTVSSQMILNIFLIFQ